MFFIGILASFFASCESKIDQKVDSGLISCDVCNYLVDALFHQANLQRQSAPYQKLDEGSVQDLIGTVCNSNKKEGEWMRKLDIVQKKTDKGVVLELVQPGGISKCKEECKTITKTCEALLEDDIDPDDLAVLIWKNQVSLQDAKKKVCSDWSKKCNKKPKIVPYPRIDEEFHVMSEKDLQMEQLMASMKDAGMGGMNMYNKDDMENMMENGGLPGMDGYDDLDDMYGYGGEL